MVLQGLVARRKFIYKLAHIMQPAATMPWVHQLKLPAFIIAVLGAGTANYFYIRPDIALFRAFSITREPLFIPATPVRMFLAGYFSDITWCVALCATIFFLRRKGFLETWGSLLVLTLPFLTEAAQYAHIIPGTFDWFDMVIYAAIVTTFIIFTPILKFHGYEKT
ncbi:MAG: hypothetical protein K0Q66_1686 [Chitinophagaceae bacterium]|jgi:hypothetical protein|nr:hypothetical protein [Chitinophagaceae bacterium]